MTAPIMASALGSVSCVLSAQSVKSVDSFHDLAHKTLILQRLRTEIQNQADLMAGSFKVIDNPPLFCSAESCDGLDLNNHGVETNEVGSISRAQSLALVENWQF